MKICNKCKYPLLTAYCVVYKEVVCFHCGETYEFFNDCEDIDETPELITKEKEMEEIKKKIYDMGFEKEENIKNSKGITQEELKKRMEKIK